MPATLSIAQHTGSDTPGGTTTIPTLSYTNAQVAKNLNIVGVNWQAAVTSVQVTDTANNPYKKILSFPGGLTAPSSISEIWCCLSIAAAAAGNLVSVQFSGASTSPEIFLVEAHTTSGVWNVGPTDTGTAASGTAMATKGVVLSSAPALGFAFGISGNGSGLNGSGAWNNLDNLAGGDTDIEQIFSSTGLATATATQGTSAAWDLVAAYFFVSGGIRARLLPLGI